MPEISLNKGLTGTEVLESIIHEIRHRLSRHGRLGYNSTYPGYRAEITVRIYPAQSAIPPLEDQITVDQMTPELVAAALPVIEETVEIPVKPPNRVREDADLGIPVAFTDKDGNIQEKTVKVKTATKNKVRGGTTKTIESEPLQTMYPTQIPVDGEL